MSFYRLFKLRTNSRSLFTITIMTLSLGLFFTTSQVSAESLSQDEQPCLVIKRACSKAGFKKSKDCFKKVLEGQSVSGVNIDASIVSKCQDK